MEIVIEQLNDYNVVLPQAGIYKRELHQRFLRRWIEEKGASAKRTFEELWKFREQCIGALTHSHQDFLNFQIRNAVRATPRRPITRDQSHDSELLRERPQGV